MSSVLIDGACAAIPTPGSTIGAAMDAPAFSTKTLRKRPPAKAIPACFVVISDLDSLASLIMHDRRMSLNCR
jgi:hypothetical protein